MIGRIAGTLIEKNPPHLLVDCHGVGYEIDVPMSTFYNLPATGEKVALLTQQIVREDAHLLYGFGTTAERETFRQLIKISGIGARIALAVLSGMSVAELAQAVTLQEAGRLTRIPGIGKRPPSACCSNSRASSAPTWARCRAVRPCRTMRSMCSTPCWRWATPTRKPRRPSSRCRPAPASPKASSWRSRPSPRADAPAARDGKMARPRSPAPSARHDRNRQARRQGRLR